VVCVRNCGSHAQLVECIRRLCRHTEGNVPIVICAEPGSDPGADDSMLCELDGTGGRVSRAASLTVAIDATAPADVVILTSDCRVADGWLDGLHHAASGDMRVATVIALTDGGELEHPDQSLDDTAAALRDGSLRLRPHVESAAGPCVYVRRSAFELLGGSELVQVDAGRLDGSFSRCCLERGLIHVVADDVLVGSSRGSGDRANPGEAAAPMRRTLAAARRVLRGLSVMIDARILGGSMNGTKVHALELIGALARTERAQVTAIVPAELGADTRTLLESLPGVALAAAEGSLAEMRPGQADVVHRPFQISTPADMAFLAPLGERLLVTHQDLISYHNPSYFPSESAWHEYRALTRRALRAADRVVFFSAHVRDDAFAEELIEPYRATVVHIGVDHTVTRAVGAHAVPPSGIVGLDGTQMMLCLGTDFLHKNRLFALRVLDSLQRRHGWGGRLILAGPHVAVGSSIADEDRLLAANPRLANGTVRLGHVTEPEKTWLLRRANLVLYPSVHEGFGLIPFEAAEHDTPCLWAPGTALSEVLPDRSAGIIPWDADASADRALELMSGPAPAADIVRTVRRAADCLSWDKTAERLLDTYEQACREPVAAGALIERSAGLMRSGLSEDAMRLVGPGGALPPDLERPMLALATHPRLGSPVFRAIKAGYRLGYRLRRSASLRNGR
jgi:glycosyltransferase involved in cell wall biosynthesis